jgi:hypothetical protein
VRLRDDESTLAYGLRPTIVFTKPIPTFTAFFILEKLSRLPANSVQKSTLQLFRSYLTAAPAKRLV